MNLKLSDDKPSGREWVFTFNDLETADFFALVSTRLAINAEVSYAGFIRCLESPEHRQKILDELHQNTSILGRMYALILEERLKVGPSENPVDIQAHKEYLEKKNSYGSRN